MSQKLSQCLKSYCNVSIVVTMSEKLSGFPRSCRNVSTIAAISQKVSQCLNSCHNVAKIVENAQIWLYLIQYLETQQQCLTFLFLPFMLPPPFLPLPPPPYPLPPPPFLMGRLIIINEYVCCPTGETWAELLQLRQTSRRTVLACLPLTASLPLCGLRMVCAQKKSIV